MKRFVDIRTAQIRGVRFAWWDTVRDHFETHNGEQGWSTWAEFAVDYGGGNLERYQKLVPQWAFETDEDIDRD